MNEYFCSVSIECGWRCPHPANNQHTTLKRSLRLRRMGGGGGGFFYFHSVILKMFDKLVTTSFGKFPPAAGPSWWNCVTVWPIPLKSSMSQTSVPIPGRTFKWFIILPAHECIMRPAQFGLEARWNHTVFVTGEVHTAPATHTTLHFGAALPCGVFGIMLLVLFTFNVTETENTAQQPFITKPWEIGGHASLSLAFSSLAVYLLHCSTLYPSINCASFSAARIHCLKFTHGTQKPPLHNPPFHPHPLYLSPFSAVIHLKVASSSRQMEEI